MSARNRLVITTPSDLEIAMARDFDAPRALVWEMFTRPEHVRQWWGYKHLEITVCEIDLRVGGAYRYSGRTPNGTEVPFCGVYREIVAPERMTYTEIFDVPMARDHEGVVTTTFTEKAGKTTVYSVVRYDTKETRDMVLGSGMESGVESGYAQIDTMLETQVRKVG
jgi:uncharacterized protein YndB with AHSA1/START domain